MYFAKANSARYKADGVSSSLPSSDTQAQSRACQPNKQAVANQRTQTLRASSLFVPPPTPINKKAKYLNQRQPPRRARTYDIGNKVEEALRLARGLGVGVVLSSGLHFGRETVGSDAEGDHRAPACVLQPPHSCKARAPARRAAFSPLQVWFATHLELRRRRMARYRCGAAAHANRVLPNRKQGHWRLELWSVRAAAVRALAQDSPSLLFTQPLQKTT